MSLYTKRQTNANDRGIPETLAPCTMPTPRRACESNADSPFKCAGDRLKLGKGTANVLQKEMVRSSYFITPLRPSSF